MFTARKAGQMSAYFARRQGGKINVLKLMKLLYLADRESMALYGAPISFDQFVSMDHGPVLTRVLNLINGTYHERVLADWEQWMSQRAHYDVACNREFDREDLDCLSKADLDVLDDIWNRFGHMNQWELVEYTHDLAEWQNPHGSSIPIEELTIFNALGIHGEEAEALAAEIHLQRELDQKLERM